MYLIKIAFRNLIRRSKRTLIISSILILAVISFLLLDSFMLGMMDLSFGNVIDFETPHIEIAREEFFAEADEDRELPLEQTFTPDQDVIETIKNIEGFSGMTAVLDFSADFIAGRYEFPVLVRSIDSETFSDVFKNQEYVVEGEFIKTGDEGVVIGFQLAEFFDLEVGDFFTLRFKDKHEYFNTIQGEVKGIMSTPHPEMNMRTVLIDRENTVQTLGLGEDKISQLMVRMNNRDIALTQADSLKKELENTAFEVRSYRVASEMLTSLEVWGYLETYFILALLLLIGAIGIVNVIILSALERIEEIGMMKAMGLKENEIVRVFILEATGVGITGGFIGCVLGAMGVGLLNHYGFDMETFFDFSELGVPIAGRVYGVWNFSSFVLIFILVVVIAVISSIIPAYWAARKDPVDAIHHK